MAERAALILELLDRAVPSPRRGTRVLDRALAAAGLSELPSSKNELTAFVKSSLRAILEEELGVALAREVSADLETALSPALRRCDTNPASPSSMRLKRISPAPSAATPSRPGAGLPVLIIGTDRLANASLARTLVAAGFDVATAVDDTELLLATTVRRPAAIVLDERSALEPPDSLERVLLGGSAVALLAHNCDNPLITDALLRAYGADSMAALPRGAATREVISALSALAPSPRP